MRPLSETQDQLIQHLRLAAIDRLRAELKFEPRRLRALRTAYFKKCLGADAALAELPEDVRERVRSSR